MIRGLVQSGPECRGDCWLGLVDAGSCGRLVRRAENPQKIEKRMDQHLDGLKNRVTITPADPHGFGNTSSGSGEMPESGTAL